MNAYQIHPNTFLDPARNAEKPFMVVVELMNEWEPCASFVTEREARIFIDGAICAERMAETQRQVRIWESEYKTLARDVLKRSMV